jgi:hypothetical protein
VVARWRPADWHARYAATLGPRFARLDAEQRDRIAAVVRDVSGRAPVQERQ